jgi:hypothetical protein
MAKDNLTPQENGLLQAILANPEAVAEWLDEIQYTACAGLIRFPELAKGTTAHIFSGADPLYVEVYRAVNAGDHGLVDVFVSISRRQHSAKSALALAALACHPVSRGEASRTIARLKKFVAWQYRQEKAKKVAK